MMTKHSYFAASLALVGIGLHPGVAAATSIDIQNYSFELPNCTTNACNGNGGGFSIAQITGWSGAGNFGVQVGNTSSEFPVPNGTPGNTAVPDGAQNAYLGPGSTISQTLSGN